MCACGNDLPGRCPGRANCPNQQGPDFDERVEERVAEIMDSVYEVADRLDGTEIALTDSVILQMVEANRRWNYDAQMAAFGRAVITAVEQIAIRPSVMAELGESVDDGDRSAWS